MLQTAIILAGGFGTRLQSVVNNVPKPMAPVCGQPFLNYQLRWLKKHGFKKIILSVGHLHQAIMDYYKHEFEGLSISYALEKEALGTGGGIKHALEQCDDKEVLVLNGDSLFNFDAGLFYRLHRQQQRQVSLALRRVKNAGRYGSIETGNGGRIIAFNEKQAGVHEGLINAGVYILEKEFYLQNTPAKIKFSIETDFFRIQAAKDTLGGFEFDGYFIDIGIPEDYIKAQDDFKGFEY